MKRFTLICSLLAIVAIAFTTRTAGAQEADAILAHYRVLPRFSTLEQTGGFAGFDWRFRLLGEYDLARGDAAGTPTMFAKPEIWGSRISSGPVTADVLDVDQVLNLAGLQGERLPVAAPFHVYRFTGETADGSSVNLLASMIGPWMYVRGGTQPPQGSADFFQYQIRMLARSRPFADFNDDGRVDGADYVLARNADSSGASLADWRTQFGEVVPNIAAMDAQLSAAVGSGSTIPEPTSLALILIGTLFGCRRIR